ncbi:MAG: cbb3-type cytochrome c oxidase subunit I [Bacteroidia bacterium]
MKKNIPLIFISMGLSALAFGALIGFLISIVYIQPDFLKDILPFNQLRPLHTSSVVAWIILTAIGGIYFYVSQEEKYTLFSTNLMKAHLVIYVLVSVCIFYSLFSGNMGGREYLEFFPLLVVPILLGWILFGINFYKTVFKNAKNWPVYYWMWAVGIVFMIFHLSEAHFWMFTHFRSDFIRDLTVQWKSYGSFVGSWNMLVYGTSFYVMSKIKNDDSIARGKITFFFFFLGLSNLMFGWAHHTYILPTLPWVRYVSYIISMTEWIILISIIYTWAKSLSKEKKRNNLMAYRFLIASEFWVFVNLIIALLISIPSINFYTHGTHITVAHSMGTTIGINTTILLGSVSFILSRLGENEVLKSVWVKLGFWIFNISLAIFLFSLIMAGFLRAAWVNHAAKSESFSSLHDKSTPYFIVFVVAGGALLTGILLIALPMVNRTIIRCSNDYKE